MKHTDQEEGQAQAPLSTRLWVLKNQQDGGGTADGYNYTTFAPLGLEKEKTKVKPFLDSDSSILDSIKTYFYCL